MKKIQVTVDDKQDYFFNAYKFTITVSGVLVIENDTSVIAAFSKWICCQVLEDK